MLTFTTKNTYRHEHSQHNHPPTSHPVTTDLTNITKKAYRHESHLLPLSRLYRHTVQHMNTHSPPNLPSKLSQSLPCLPHDIVQQPKTTDDSTARHFVMQCLRWHKREGKKGGSCWNWSSIENCTGLLWRLTGWIPRIQRDNKIPSQGHSVIVKCRRGVKC